MDFSEQCCIDAMRSQFRAKQINDSMLNSDNILLSCLLLDNKYYYIVINIFQLISMENNRAVYPCISIFEVVQYST